MKKLIKNAIFTLFTVFYASYNFLVAANIDRNYDYHIHESCYNNNNTDKCYPFWYENSDGSSNQFANIIAALNYVSPFINLLSYKLGSIYMKKIDQDINAYVTENLENLESSENKIKILLTKIITDFNNGIGTYAGDQSSISGAVASLNRDKCQTCINQFVEIVSNTTTNKKDRREHRENFLQFADKLTDNCMVENHKKMSGPCDKERTFSDKAKTACCYKWTHPFHWSSIIYAFSSAAISGVTPFLLDVNNRAGSYIGDMANISNIIVIPTCYAFNCYQYGKNSDRTKEQKLAQEINNHLVRIDGIIEIAAQVIGKMDNAFNEDTSKVIITALVLVAWPEKQVNKFIKLASDNETTDDQVKKFVAKLKTLYQEKHYGRKSIDKLFTEKQELNVTVNDQDSY